MSEIRQRLEQARLYGIVDLAYVSPEKAPRALEQMLLGGVQVVQLRAKNFSPEELAPLASGLVAQCRAAEVPFVINDHPSLARTIGADIVHVGQDDLTVGEARHLSGGLLVGKSTHSVEQAQQAFREGADYLGFGPLFATPTKPDYTPIGTQDIRQAYAEVSVPVFCIGGIKLENLPGVLNSGAQRVVIVSGLLQAADIAAYARQCRVLLDP